MKKSGRKGERRMILNYSRIMKEKWGGLVMALLHGPFLLPVTTETREERRGTNSQYEKSVSVAAEEGEAAAAVMTPSPYGAPSH